MSAPSADLRQLPILPLVAACGGILIGFAVNATVPTLWLAFAIPLLSLAAAAHLRSRRFLPIAAIALAVTPMPLSVPLLLPFGGRSLFVLDLVLPVAALLAARWRTTRSEATIRFYVAAMVALSLVGILRGASLTPIIQDLRGPVYLFCGYYVASRALQLTDGRRVLQAAGGVLWWSTAAILFALQSGQEFLHGRVGQTAAFADGGKRSLDAVRFLIASKELALISAIGVVATLLLRSSKVRTRDLVVGVLVPAVFVVVMAFSRQSILGAAVAAVFLLVVSPWRSQTALRLVAGGGVAAGVLLVLAGAGVLAPLTASDTLIGRQLDGYEQRVLTGLAGDNVTQDQGNQFRVLENRAAIDYAMDNPLAGAGLGRPYRGDLGLEAFKEDPSYGQRYVHNVYLWYAAHGGILGIAAVTLLLGRPFVTVLWPAFRDGDPEDRQVLAAGASYSALIAIGLVEPVMHLNSTAPLVGAFLGYFALVESRRGRDGREGPRARRFRSGRDADRARRTGSRPPTNGALVRRGADRPHLGTASGLAGPLQAPPPQRPHPGG